MWSSFLGGSRGWGLIHHLGPLWLLVRPPPPPLDDPGGWRTGWQHEAASRVERHFRDTSLMPRMHNTEKALLRSQSGPLSGAALSTAPTCFHMRIESHLFRLLLLRRLRLPLPVCRCGGPLHSFGTIAQCVHGRVCLRDVASRWRWPQPRCAG